MGEGLVGTIGATGEIINTDDASTHPSFAFRPETGEEVFHSFLGVPIVRGGGVAGVLVVQNSARKVYAEDDVDALQVIASILAEMFTTGGILDGARYTDVQTVGREPRRLEGLRLVDGIAIGRAWLHAPRIEVEQLLSDDPEREAERLDAASQALRSSLDSMLERSDLGSGEHLEILETYRMFAHDGGWLRRIHEAILTGVTAEAAVRGVQEETQLRLGHASDPYLRERLLDLDDLANRLLMSLAGRDPAKEARAMPDGSIIVARNLSAADLIEYDRSKMRGVIVEEGSSTAHVTVVARAFDVPMLGRVSRAMSIIRSGDRIALDGDNGQAFLRPSEDVVEAFRRSVRVRTERRRHFDAVRDEPSVTRDGVHISLSINAAFLVDLAELQVTGAEGVGLYRTELAFMARPDFPNPDVQSSYLFGCARSRRGSAGGVSAPSMSAATSRCIIGRCPRRKTRPWAGGRCACCSIGPRFSAPSCAPCCGLPLDAKFQIDVPHGGRGVGTHAGARNLLDLELDRSKARGLEAPELLLEVGAMMEVPALYWQLRALLPRVDFISVGSNDLIQFLFACDRGSPTLNDRYDVLSPPALSFLRALVHALPRGGREAQRLRRDGQPADRGHGAWWASGCAICHCLQRRSGRSRPWCEAWTPRSLSTYMLRQLDLARPQPAHSPRWPIRGIMRSISILRASDWSAPARWSTGAYGWKSPPGARTPVYLGKPVLQLNILREN